MPTFDVQIIAPDGTVLKEITVAADNVEGAAREVTGDPRLHRGAGKATSGLVLRAKVYHGPVNSRSLVRFFGSPMSDAARS